MDVPYGRAPDADENPEKAGGGLGTEVVRMPVVFYVKTTLEGSVVRLAPIRQRPARREAVALLDEGARGTGQPE